MHTTIVTAIRDGVSTITLAPPAEGKPPTLDHAVFEQLDHALTELESLAGELRLVFVRSASPRTFCAGGNLQALETIDASSIVPWVEHGHRVFNRLEDLPVPVVARVEGYALGGGLELAMACDLIFASETARFGQTEARLGFVAGWGGSWRLPRRVGLACARELFFTGCVIDGAEAERIGLVDFCGSPTALEDHCRSFAESVLACSALAHTGHKRLLAAAFDASRDDGCRGEIRESVLCAGSDSTRRRVAAFLAARARKPPAPSS